MKFESFEVKEKFYKLHKQYGIQHCNLGNRYDNIIFTTSDLEDLEEDFKKIIKIFDDMD